VHIIGEWLRRVWYLLNRGRFDDALKLEMEAHRALMGDPARFGNTLRLREDARDVWGWSWLENFVRDVRLAGRTLRRTPGFAIVAVSSLAVGFALVTSTVAVLNAYLIRGLPYPAADRLYNVMYAPPGPWEPGGMSALDWASLSDVVEFPITASGGTFYLMDGGYTQTARGLRATPGFLEGLGVRAVMGRSLTSGDFGAASERAALIGYALWRDRYGSDPEVVGRSLRAEPEGGTAAETFRIAGVLPPDFYYGRDSSARVDLLVPLTSPVRTYMVRLRAGVPPGFAERRITDAARRVGTEIPSNWTGVHLESAHDRYVGQLRPVLAGMTVASGLVLIIVCANIAVLVLLRTLRRQKELAVRAALGSRRLHLARMLVVETSIVCGAALGAGAALTWVLLRLLAPTIETQLGRPAPGGSTAIAIDATVLVALGALGVVTALLLSLVPLVMPWQRRLADALRLDGTSATDGRSMRHLRSALIAFEVAGTLILFVGCGLMVRSIVEMVQTDFGFRAEHLVRTRVVLRGADYADPPAFFRFYEQFTERLASIVDAPVVFTSWPPFDELPAQKVEIDGRPGHRSSAGAIAVGAGYFRTLGIELRSGRDFTDADMSGAEPVAVISETLARRLWPDGTGVGRQVRGVELTGGGSTAGPWRTVVGVAADVRQTYADGELGDLYVPLSPAAFGRFGSFYLRTDRPPSSLLDDMRGVAAQLDAHAVIDPPRSVTTLNRELAGTTFLTTMLTGFAGIAGFLAVLGIYGVTAYAVRQREREIAIRMALGAAANDVVRLFLRESGLVLAAGLGFGLIGAVSAATMLRNQLYGVRPFDASTLAATCLLLATAGVVATWWPARRASLQNPTGALKEG
jgi:predicted permease